MVVQTALYQRVPPQMWRPFLSPHDTERPAGNEPTRAAAFIENNTVVLGGRWGWDWVDVKGQLSGNRGDNLRSIRLMLTRPFPPLCLISSEPPMLVSERNWIKASQASVRLSLSPFVPCTLYLLSIFFPPPLLHDLSYLALGGRGWMEGWGDDLRKWDMLIRAVSARCAVKTETVVIITSCD